MCAQGVTHIIIHPCRQVRVGIRFNVLVDIRRRREVWRVTANVFLVWSLVYTDVVDTHRRGEGETFKVDVTKVFGHSQVDDDVL